MAIIGTLETRTRMSRPTDHAASQEVLTIVHSANSAVSVIEKDYIAPKAQRRIDFLAGAFKIPDDFNQMGQREIEEMFVSE